MDNETFDQIHLGDDMVGELMVYLKENDSVKVVLHDEHMRALQVRF